MNTNSIQQEILLLSGTSFLTREFIEDTETNKPSSGTEQERLEEACWNGLLQAMLPEIFQPPFGHKGLFIWKVTGLDGFTGIDLGNIPDEKDKDFSIDPAAFLQQYVLS